MAKRLSPNLVRAIIREVLVSKSAILDMIIESLAEVIRPTVEAHAHAIICASIEPNPQEQLIDDLQKELRAVLKTTRWLTGLPSEDQWEDVARAEMRRITACIEHLLAYADKRRLVLEIENARGDISSSCKGGVA